MSMNQMIWSGGQAAFNSLIGKGICDGNLRRLIHKQHTTIFFFQLYIYKAIWNQRDMTLHYS